jgi:hypothetical protein
VLIAATNRTSTSPVVGAVKARVKFVASTAAGEVDKIL